MELKPQDSLVLLKVAAHPPQRWTYAALGEALSLSPSEAHASVRRAVASGLAVSAARGEWVPLRHQLLEFLLHGVRYVWPAARGPVKRGVPTAFGTEPLASLLRVQPGEAPVWAHPAGQARGPTLSPLYRSAPHAALVDPALHRLLALVDALRNGRSRERALAAELLQSELNPGKVPAEAGVFVAGGASAGRTHHSALNERARASRAAGLQRLTPAQRLEAMARHTAGLVELRDAAQAMRKAAAEHKSEES